ncbi:hypothetical protein EW093_16145 [Thiospirochaeta perfilievii]|uniref:Uncharacterized protein n=1 Tax=Thiospirochaeta perfilievii TaxID=252967 RepID=A0A5C1QIZ6_9SPIO|nr:hypothetical protein [Thiospirochaeta perfilievii]QEN06152.1 hypothetical protein EW093_16145 [Thiospirochaeta perfilievii]
MDDVREQFIKEREERYGGSISFISFAKYIGSSLGNKPENLSGLIYIIGQNIYFEDFQPSPSILLTNRDQTPYRKFEIAINLDDILEAVNVKELECKKSINGLTPSSEITGIKTWFEKLFFKSVVMIRLKDKSSIFLDITNNKVFLTKI